jgi:hypothetical protein
MRRRSLDQTRKLDPLARTVDSKMAAGAELKRGFRAATHPGTSRSAVIEARVAVRVVPLPDGAKRVPRLGVGEDARVIFMRKRAPMFMTGRVWLLSRLLRRLRLRERNQRGGRWDLRRVNKLRCGRGRIGRESRIRVNGGL